jgi:hypothetical protein
MQKIRLMSSFLALLWLLPGYSSDDPFVGFFSGELDGNQYEVTIDRVNSTTYDGLMQIGGERMQLDARRYGEWVGGILRSHTAQIRFRAELRGSALIFETEDGRRVVLWRTKPQ